MIRLSFFLLTILVTFCTFASAQNSLEIEIDFMASLEQDTVTSQEIGLYKLKPEEKAQWNVILNTVYQMGKRDAQQGRAPVSSSAANQTKQLPPQVDVVFPSGHAYKSKIDSDDDDVIVLENGAIVQITTGYLGYVGYRKDCVLFRIGSQWKIWIEGKKAYRCDVLKEPESGRRISVREVFISEVKGNGTILEMSDGSIYEVDNIYTITTELWLGMSEAIILDEYELINLDEGGEIVTISRLR